MASLLIVSALVRACPGDCLACDHSANQRRELPLNHPEFSKRLGSECDALNIEARTYLKMICPGAESITDI
jgi:hypothetical protein